MAKKKARVKNLKKQRWAAIVAGFLALGMIVSVVGVYLGQSRGPNSVDAPGSPAQMSEPGQETPVEPGPEDYLAFYEDEVERLESELEGDRDNAELLQELAGNYQYLILIQQVFFDDQEAIREYRVKMADLYESLIEIEPSVPLHRLALIELKMDLGENGLPAGEEVEGLSELLRQEPEPLIHLSLVNLLAMAGEEELFAEEATWLYEFLDEKVSAETADSEELFYFAVLVGEYLGDSVSAEEVLETILERENETSMIFGEARSYLDYLRSAQDDADDELQLPD